MQAFLDLPDGRRVPVVDGLTLGRVAGCDIVIDDTKASRRHARIVVEGGVCEIEDLQSSNGTLLNGKPVQRRVLRDGDRVQIGQTEIVYRETAASPAVGVPAPAAGAPAPAAGGPASRAADSAPTSSGSSLERPRAAPPPPVDDDVDLFGGDPTGASASPPAPARSAPPPSPAPAPASPPAPQRTPPAAPPPVPPRSTPPASPPRAVVEFADEVIEVRATPKQAPPVPRGAAGGEPTVQQKQRVLQFAKNADRGGALGDDLAQASGGYRALVYAAVLVGAGALFWLIVRLVG